MLSIDEALKLTDIDKIHEQVSLRWELIRKMVGRLYPSILRNEICQLNCRASDIKFKRIKDKE